jgi:UDP-glucose 4-epimerase
MRIAVTGASGNIGTAVLRRLGADGGHEVVGLARRPPEREPRPGVRWFAVDLTEDGCSPVLREAFGGLDAVVHLAWGFQPSHDLRYLEELGVGGTRRVVQAATAAGVPHLVHMSSVGAYSPKQDDRPVDESWPHDGVPTSWYSRAKAAAEQLRDAHEAAGEGPTVARVRPGIVGQEAAGSALLRYALPAVVPARALDLVPVLPLDRRLTFPMVHADDVADAVVRILTTRATGPFNLMADPPLTTGHLAEALGTRAVHLPSPVVRAVVSATWHARLQPVDPGWCDLGFAVPLLDTTRASRELGWSPTVDAMTVLKETLAGMREAAAGRTPVLRPRTVLGQLRETFRSGPVTSRRRP